MSYDELYGSSSQVPVCYGEVDDYDSADPVCRDCGVENSCRRIVHRKVNEEAASSGGRRRTISRTAPTVAVPRRRRQEPQRPAARSDVVRRRNRSVAGLEEHEEGDTFMGVFARNSVLGTLHGMLEEAQAAVASVPLKKYPPLLRKPTKKDE